MITDWTHSSLFLGMSCSSSGPSKAVLQDMLSNLGGEEPVPPPSSSAPPSRPRPITGIDLTDEPGMCHVDHRITLLETVVYFVS